MTIEHLRSLWCGLDLSNSFDIVVFAVACVAFWCFCRLGELIIDLCFDPSSHFSHSTDFMHGIAAIGIKYINFHVPHTKMKEGGEDFNIMDSTCLCSAMSTLEHHLSSNTAFPESAPLFTFETADGQWAPMKRE